MRHNKCLMSYIIIYTLVTSIYSGTINFISASVSYVNKTYMSNASFSGLQTHERPETEFSIITTNNILNPFTTNYNKLMTCFI